MSQVGLPLTGVGGTTADVATDAIGGLHFQYVKKADGLAGSSVVERILATTPGSGDAGSVVRPIASTAFNQAVVLTSGSLTIGAVDLTSVGSTKTIGVVTINPISTGTTMGSVALLAGTSANTVGSVALVAGTSANTIGAVAQAGPATSGVYWFMQSIPFSSGNLARTTVNTTVDISVVAANASRKALVIANLSTSQTVALGLSTGAVTTGLTNANILLAPISQVAFGIHGSYPLFLGPVRGINITSTIVAGGVAVMDFT